MSPGLTRHISESDSPKTVNGAEYKYERICPSGRRILQIRICTYCIRRIIKKTYFRIL